MDFAGTLLARWNALSRNARLACAAAAIAVAVAAIGIELFAHPPRVPLFAGPLHAEQLAEVEERLAAWNVAFTPVADNAIVAAGRRNDLLLRLSLAGVPHPHVAGSGEALAGVGVLTPQAVIDAQTRAGLAGDIEGALRGIDGLDDAAVIVSPAKNAEFGDQSARDPSAGVRLRLRAGTQLSHATISGIRALVAAAVPGLQPSHVTIVDDRGVALADRDDGDDASGLQRSLQSALDAAFGEGATIVRVGARFSAERTDVRETKRVALGAPIARSTRSDSYDAQAKRFRHIETTEDSGEATEERTTQTPGGELKSLSAAVFVDAARNLDLPAVRNLAAGTLGYDPARGDTLTVAAVDFARTASPRKSLWWLAYGAIVPLLPVLVVAIAGLAIARTAVGPFATLLQQLAERATLRRTSTMVAGFPPARVRSVLEHEPPHAAAAIISALPAATAAAVLEMYPPQERDAIVTRMQRPRSPLILDPQELLRRHA